jgi:hypothetical protein
MGGVDVVGFKLGNGGQCDLTSYELTPPTAVIGSSAELHYPDGRVAHITAGSDEMTVKAHTRGLVWKLQGSGAPPQVTISGPGGVSLATSTDGTPVKTSDALVLQDPTADATYVILAAPKAGHWIISPVGSSTISSISTAGILPPPHVTASVTGKGLARELHYTLTPIKGQSVRFLEHKGTFTHVIATVTKDRGVVKFTPADGPTGRRTILAQVLQGISIRKQLTVAHYTTPPHLGPQRPLHLVASHRRKRLYISWRSGGGSSEYLVDVKATSGATTVVATDSTRASVKLATVSGARVEVTPRTKFAEQGLPAIVKLPAPVAPKLRSRPRVTGTARVDETVRCTRGSWSGHPTRYVIEWMKSGITIAKAHHTKFKLLNSDNGKRISCAVTARNAVGFAAADSHAVRVKKRLRLKKPRSDRPEGSA